MIVAVNGAPGCGKTTFAAALAAKLAAKGETRILLINADYKCPALGLWAPKAKHPVSIGRLLSIGINEDLLERFVTICPENDNLALLGYAPGEKEEDYDPISEHSAGSLIGVMEKLADITVVDGTDYSDALTSVAAAKADMRLEIFPADPRGILYLKSLSEIPAVSTQEKLYLTYVTSTFDPIVDIIRGMGISPFAVIPFIDEAHRKLTAGQLFTPYKSRDYNMALSRISEIACNGDRND